MTRASASACRVGVTLFGQLMGHDLKPPLRRTLPAPLEAELHRRHLFRPRRGWFRRLERNVSILLTRYLYPRVPLLSVVYDWQLDWGLTLSEADIAIHGLPAAFDGLKILLLTDLHAGPFVSKAALERSWTRLCRAAPDLILVGGDIVTTDLRELDPSRLDLGSLDAPLGVYGVLGNHDHYTRDPATVLRVLGESGIEMLHNSSVDIVREGARLSLAGVDDMNAGQPDLDAALARACQPVILLSHNPDLFLDAANRGVDLMLSGHTHGGQIRIPGRGVMVRQSRFHLDEGLYRLGKAQLVVSRGLGVTGVPLRIGCPPEGVLIRLVAADG